MASPGGASSGSSLQQNSSSEEERKRKRMESNRESARRSRLRKQNYLEEMTVQVSHMRKNKQELMNSINVTTQQYLKMDAENSVLRAQMSELMSRLEYLNEISNAVMTVCNNNHGDANDASFMQEPFASDSFFMNPWETTTSFNQPIMASATMFQN